MMLNCSIVIMENRGLPEWRDSFASAPVGADRGSARSSPRRRRSSAPHLIFRVSLHTNKKCYKPQKRFIAFWSEWRDSNSRHPGPKPGALPTGPHPDRMQFLRQKSRQRTLRRIEVYYTRLSGKMQYVIFCRIKIS